MKLSDKSAPGRYPLGRSKETYFWAFIVSLFLFFMGGVFAVYEGVHLWRKHHPHHHPPHAHV